MSVPDYMTLRNLITQWVSVIAGSTMAITFIEGYRWLALIGFFLYVTTLFFVGAFFAVLEERNKHGRR